MTSPGGGGARSRRIATSFPGAVVPARARVSFAEGGSGAESLRATVAFDAGASDAAQGLGWFARAASQHPGFSRGLGTTSRRHIERGANTPTNLVNG
jgi:hypothetical protein